MKISIIIPIYNSEKYLERCLDSVLAQTYSNIEIILINDGSKDDSLAICELFAIKDERIIIINQNNKGPAAARNTGVRIAKGQYIGFVDSDDFIDCEMYENLASCVRISDADVIVSNFKVYNSDNTKSSLIRNSIPYGKILPQNEIKEFFIAPYYGGILGIIPSLCNKIYKLDFIIANAIEIDESRVRAEDYWFNFHVFTKARTVFTIDQAYYHYYKNEGSIMHTYRENQFELYLKTRQDLLKQNESLKCRIDWSNFNVGFVNNTNEFILLCIKNISFFRGYKKAMQILKNNEFSNAIQNISINNLHNRLIKFFLYYKLYMFVYLIYYSWSKKI